MRNTWNQIKTKPMTWAGAVIVLAYFILAVTGQIDLATFEAKVMELTMLVLGGGLLFKATTSSVTTPIDEDEPPTTPLPNPTTPRPVKKP